MKIPPVFLDRDGVINRSIVIDRKPFPPKTVSEFEIIPGVVEAISLLKDSGFFLTVVTNQPDVGRGTMEKKIVEAINNRMLELLPIDDVRVCYDDGLTINSEFRKPNPGMILASAEQFNLDLKKSFMVGDRWKDIAAGARAGCKTFFIDYGYNEPLRNQPDYTVSNLLEAAQIIVKQMDIT